ncbi:MAG: hypothetical protein ACKOEC_14865 [Acidimicrobiia bacterium]
MIISAWSATLVPPSKRYTNTPKFVGATGVGVDVEAVGTVVVVELVVVVVVVGLVGPDEPPLQAASADSSTTGRAR